RVVGLRERGLTQALICAAVAGFVLGDERPQDRYRKRVTQGLGASKERRRTQIIASVGSDPGERLEESDEAQSISRLHSIPSRISVWASASSRRWPWPRRGCSGSCPV